MRKWDFEAHIAEGEEKKNETTSYGPIWILVNNNSNGTLCKRTTAKRKLNDGERFVEWCKGAENISYIILHSE